MLKWRFSAEPECLNKGTSDEIKIVGYTSNRNKLLLTALLCLLTCFLLLFLLAWKHSIRLWFTSTQCPLQYATKILCTDIYGQQWEEEVVDPVLQASRNKRTSVSSVQSANHVISSRYFVNRNIKYIWDFELNMFTKLTSKEFVSSLHDIYDGRDGLTSSEAKGRRTLFGDNIIKIEVLSILQLIWIQIKNPFYLYQLYTITLWSLEVYFSYTIFIALVTLLSISFSVYETKRQSESLRRTMTSVTEMHVIRSNTKQIVSSVDVVPGDAVVLEPDTVLEVDMVLIEGDAVVTEALLTGESIPTSKVGISRNENLQELFSYSTHNKHILYSGSKLIQIRGGTSVTGVVINTGFNTSKGEMVRSILFPRPINFLLMSDFLKMFFFLLVTGLAISSWSFYTWLSSEATVAESVFHSLDLMTYVVPAILPATLAAVNVWGQRRLKKKNIYCLSSNYLSLAGPVDIVCFDKTGTLTEDTLKVVGVVPTNAQHSFSTPVEDLKSLSGRNDLFTYALASCHTLTPNTNEMSDEFTNNLLGHPMDISILNRLQWELSERDSGCINTEYDIATPILVRPKDQSRNSVEIAQLKIFPFESSEQRMTVIAKVKGSYDFMVFVKGAPEKLVENCDPKTVPKNFEQVLTWYTLQGLRVLALVGSVRNDSWYELESQKRSELESYTTFLGFVLFHNPMKISTPMTISVLQNAEIRTVMITGDNMATAISVARSSNLVKPEEQMLIVNARFSNRSGNRQTAKYLKVTYHNTLNKDEDNQSNATDDNLMASQHVFVIDGRTWELIREHKQDLLSRIAHQGRVFVRMKPDQKVQVVEQLQELGYQVAMCGDGCNDCGALKVAHVGISLSSAESSVAAPFTSSNSNIDCVEKIILEGRATLISSYACFKYTICYGFTSLFMVMLHYSIHTIPSSGQYVVMDMIISTIPALAMGNIAPSEFLVAEKPTQRFLHPVHITSLLSFLFIQTCGYLLCWSYTQQQAWFEPFEFIPGLNVPPPSYENSALIVYFYYSLLTSALVFSHSTPFRKHVYTNYILTVHLVVATLIVLFINFYHGEGFVNLLNFREFPTNTFRWIILIASIINFLFCFLWERFFLYGVVTDKLLPLWNKLPFSMNKPHQKLSRELQKDIHWPPVSDWEKSTEDEDELRSSDDPTMNIEENEFEDDESQTEVLMMRKLSRRRQFKATVKRLNPQEESTYFKPTNNLVVLSDYASPSDRMLYGGDSFSGHLNGPQTTDNNQPLHNSWRNGPESPVYDVPDHSLNYNLTTDSNLPTENLYAEVGDGTTGAENTFTEPSSTVEQP